MSLRVFLLVRPPFMDEGQGLFWAKRSLDASFDAGAEVCCLIPTRGGNGAMEALAAAGDFAPPLLSSLEAAQEVGIRLGRGRVFADLWEIERFTTCRCSMSRIERIMAMNATQRIPAPTHCGQCKLTRE